MAYNPRLIYRQEEEDREIKDWEIFTLEDAYDKYGTHTEYIIEGMFALSSLNIVYGPPGCLKSFLLADAAICVATGKRWLAAHDGDEKIGFDTKGEPQKVVWIDFDNGRRRTHERFAALGKAHDISEEAPLNYVSMDQPWLDSHRIDHIKKLAEIFDDAALIIIDNLGTVSGGVEENSSKMVQVMGNLRYLAEKTNTAVVVIHHQRKSSKDQGPRQGDALRGHSSIEASLDLALQVRRKENRDFVKVLSTKARGPKIRPFGATLQIEHFKGYMDLRKARFWGSEPEADPKEQEIDVAVRKVLRGRDEPIQKTKFVAKVHKMLYSISKAKIKKRVKYLVEIGELEMEELRSRGKPHVYSLPE